MVTGRKGTIAVTDELQTTIAGCIASHRRLEASLRAVDDAVVSRPSQLPGWTVGHVLTHLARNADSHRRMLEAALGARSVEQYGGPQGGVVTREREIEAGASRAASELTRDVTSSAASLEEAWAMMTPEAWRGHGLSAGSQWPCWLMPFIRWREVEVHHVDLGLGYGVDDWPEDYVARELSAALVALSSRLPDSHERRAVLGWLMGRADEPRLLRLKGWETSLQSYFSAPPGLGPG
jgi:maleylpyruvate isomerase